MYDAVTDPMMGQISDHTRSRWGRRRPYIMLGALFWGIVFVLIWMALPGWSQGAKFVYLVAMGILFATGATIFIIPYMALGAEMTLDYHERSNLSAYRIGFMQIGQVVGTGMLWFVSLLKAHLPHAIDANSHASSFTSRIMNTLSSLPNKEWTIAAIIIAVFSTILMFLSGLIPRERFETRAAQRFSLWQAFRTTFSNANFRRVAGTYLTFYGLTFLGNFMLPYLMIYCVKKPSYVMPLYGIAAVSGLLTLPLWLRLGHIFEKSVVLRIICVWESITCPIILLVFNSAHPWLIFILSVYHGSGQAAFETYCHSMVGDVTDEDERETGHRREGMYFGTYNFLLKCAISVGLLWSGFGLALVGYVPNAEQSVGTLWGMKLMFGIPFLSVLSGLFYMRRYSLDSTQLNKIHEELSQKRSANACTSLPVA